MSTLQELVNSINSQQRRYFKHVGIKEGLEQLLHEQETALEEARVLEQSYQKLQKFFQAMGTDEQAKLQRWFEGVITYGLVHVFGTYRFVITQPEIKSNEVSIGFKVIEHIEGEDLERDPYEEMGGGVADVLSFLLQFVMVFLLRDRIAPILFLDEAMKHLATQYRPAVAELLQELTIKTPVRIVMITHDPVFAEKADTVYKFDKPAFETVVTRVK